MKRQSMEQDKIFVNHISRKQLISRIYKETQQEENQTTELNNKTWINISWINLNKQRHSYGQKTPDKTVNSTNC